MAIGFRVQPITETQIVTTYLNVMDVNVTTRSKAFEEHVFKDRKPRKQIMLLIGRKKNG